MYVKHCNTEFKKQVLPKFDNPAPIREAGVQERGSCTGEEPPAPLPELGPARGWCTPLPAMTKFVFSGLRLEGDEACCCELGVAAMSAGRKFTRRGGGPALGSHDAPLCTPEASAPPAALAAPIAGPAFATIRLLIPSIKAVAVVAAGAPCSTSIAAAPIDRCVASGRVEGRPISQRKNKPHCACARGLALKGRVFHQPLGRQPGQAAGDDRDGRVAAKTPNPKSTGSG